MAPIEVAFIVVVLVGVAIAIVASIRIMREREGVGRSLAQLAFVWLVPFIGPLVTMQILRKELERGAGAYPPEAPSFEYGDLINQRHATFELTSEGHSSCGEGTGGGTE